MHSIFSELSLVIAVGAIVALIMRIIKQPLIIGHIITGIIVGPTVLHLVKTPDTIEVFSKIGIALLLFIIGLGLNPKVIKEVGKVAGFAGIVQTGLTGYIGMCTGILLGFTRTESLFIGACLAFSSTIIILKLLSDKKEQSRLYGKVVVGILLLQDIIATFSLLLVTARTNGSFSISALTHLIIKGLVISIPMFIIGSKILPRMHKLIAGSQEFLFLFAVGWGFGSAALFEWAGFSVEVGALLAGVSLASLSYAQEVSARLRPLRDFFVVVFFINLGTHLTFTDVGSNIVPVIVLSLIVILIKPLSTFIPMGYMGYTRRTTFKTGSSLGQISEFSLVLVILGETAGIVSTRLVSIITLVALITIAFSTYAIIYSDKIFSLFQKPLVIFERRKTNYDQEFKYKYDFALFGYQRGGHEFLKVFRALKQNFIVIDYDPEIIETLDRQKINNIYGDATDLELLSEVGFENMKLIVSTITDHQTNIFLAKYVEKINPRAVFICHSDTAEEAEELYEIGASYVMMPHYIGSEKISSFIKKSGFRKSEFKKYREKHLEYLKNHYA